MTYITDIRADAETIGGSDNENLTKIPPRDRTNNKEITIRC